ncbi:Uncharacterised protein [Enterobacter cloacae]|nr:Uncharacterised protein [Enterobacter cloacae]
MQIPTLTRQNIINARTITTIVEIMSVIINDLYMILFFRLCESKNVPNS